MFSKDSARFPHPVGAEFGEVSLGVVVGEGVVVDDDGGFTGRGLLLAPGGHADSDQRESSVPMETSSDRALVTPSRSLAVVRSQAGAWERVTSNE